MEIKSVIAEGPSDLLEAISEVAPNYRNATGLYFYGIIEGTGRVLSLNGSTDQLTFHLRKGVDAEHAGPLIKLVMEAVAQQHDLQFQQSAIRLFYEDKNKIEHEL